MATYKVIQDIEAEDKLVGPLTLRQFIYGCIAAVTAYLSFLAITKGLSLALVFTLPPMLFTGFFAIPWGGEQTTEIWALAKIRFFLKSRRRVWDQTGVRELVTITVPKREIKQYTNGLSQTEVQSRLSALASTLDTRGWAVKNVYAIPSLMAQQATDRLLDISAMPHDVPAVGLTAADDMLDEVNNPQAQRLQQMVVSSSASHKQQLIDEMRTDTMPVLPTPKGQAADYWYMQSTNPAPPLDEKQLSNVLREHRGEEVESLEHLKTINPLSAQPPKPKANPASATPQSPTPPPPVTPPVNPATMRLAYNDDLNIATIAREANKANGSGEVVISLHRHKS